jgi:hypothetical protein
VIHLIAVLLFWLFEGLGDSFGSRDCDYLRRLRWAK